MCLSLDVRSQRGNRCDLAHGGELLLQVGVAVIVLRVDKIAALVGCDWRRFSSLDARKIRLKLPDSCTLDGNWVKANTKMQL